MHTLYSFKALGWATLGLLQVNSGNSMYFTIAAILLIAVAVLAAVVLFFIVRRNKRLSLSLQKEKQLRKLVMDYTKYVVWTVRDEYIIFSGKHTEEAGIPSLQMSLTELSAYVLPDSKASWQSFIDFRKKEGRRQIRLHIQFASEPHWFEMDYVVKSRQQSQVSGIMICVDRLVEQEKKMQELQGETQEVSLKQSFLSNISHDLRTPLNAVSGFTQLMTAEGIELSDEEMKEYNALIHQNSELMLRMIDGVMMKSQLETGEMKMKPTEISATDFIEATYQTHAILVPRNIEFIVSQDTPDRKVLFDRHRTQQVINNFLSNAFKFTPEGSVTVGWQYLQDSDEVEFFCQDTGIGVKEEDRIHLFDRFYKVAENAKGTGLGLDISRTIIEKQDGSIGVESEFGKGSRFWFRFKQHVVTLLMLLMPLCTTILTTSCNRSTDMESPLTTNAEAEIDDTSTELITWGMLMLPISVMLVIACIHTRRLTRQLETSLDEVSYQNDLAFKGSDIYRLDSKDVILKALESMHPDYKGVKSEIITALEQPGEHCYDAVAYRNGEPLWWRCRFAVNNDGTAYGYLLNVDGEHKLQELLEHAIHDSDEAKEKDTFLQRMNREIRDPLDIITSACDVLTEESPDEEQKARLFADIQKNSDKLTKLINDILQFSRIESGRLQLSKEWVKIDEFCHDFFTKGQQMIPEGVTFEMCPGRDDIYCETDPLRLNDICMQYFDNALRYAHRPGDNILFGWKYLLGKNLVQIFVEDSGDGIEDKKVKDVFDVFWRDTSFSSGVGIGLTIAKELAEKLGGHISAKSEHHKGSRFSVWIPARIGSNDEKAG